MMVIAQGQQISYHTINNFRSSEHANRLIRKSFIYFANPLQEEGLLRENSLFIDGTKIEADANKYTFVLKKAVEKYHPKLKVDALNFYEDLIQEKVIKAISEEEAMTSQGMAKMAKQVEAEVK